MLIHSHGAQYEHVHVYATKNVQYVCTRKRRLLVYFLTLLTGPGLKVPTCNHRYTSTRTVAALATAIAAVKATDSCSNNMNDDDMNVVVDELGRFRWKPSQARVLLRMLMKSRRTVVGTVVTLFRGPRTEIECWPCWSVLCAT